MIIKRSIHEETFIQKQQQKGWKRGHDVKDEVLNNQQTPLWRAKFFRRSRRKQFWEELREWVEVARREKSKSPTFSTTEKEEEEE